MNDPLINQANLLVTVLDQSAAKHEDEGDSASAKADRKLAEGVSSFGNKLREIVERIEKRIKEQDEQES